MITAKLVILAVSTTAGYVFKYMAESRKAQHAAQKHALDRLSAATASHDAAWLRAPNAGKFTRRFIVLTVYLATFGALCVAAWYGIPVVVEHIEPGRKFLFFTGKEKTIYTTLTGLYIPPAAWDIALAIAGFYFGQGAAK